MDHGLYEQADRLVSKTTFPEGTAQNSQLARWYYYVGEHTLLTHLFATELMRIAYASRSYPSDSTRLFSSERFITSIDSTSSFRLESCTWVLPTRLQVERGCRIVDGRDPREEDFQGRSFEEEFETLFGNCSRCVVTSHIPSPLSFGLM